MILFIISGVYGTVGDLGFGLTYTGSVLLDSMMDTSGDFIGVGEVIGGLFLGSDGGATFFFYSDSLGVGFFSIVLGAGIGILGTVGFFTSGFF